MVSRKVAVVTGASKGIGLEVCRMLHKRGFHVIVTARKPVVAELSPTMFGDQSMLAIHPLDISDDQSVAEFYGWLKAEIGRIDVLINNAGRVYGGHDSSVESTHAETMLEALNNNAIGAYRMIRHALPQMNKDGYGRIVNVSSGMGALTDMGSGAVPYRVSKTTLNSITQLAAFETKGDVKINAVCPGWVKTDMGGPSATRNVSEGAAGIVWGATLPADGPNGGFFRDGQPISW